MTSIDARLSQDEYFQLVRMAPLISMDLVVKNEKDEYLFGLRKNRPAQGTWFVPGGRIHKNQNLKTSFALLGLNELGREINFDNARLIGVFEHMYPDSASGEPGAGTHYVVLAYQLLIPILDIQKLPTDQHSSWKWFHTAEILECADVHECAKRFFPIS